MKIAVRVDASTPMGTGHFMRCLTLADAMKQHGALTRFVSRHMPEHLCNMLEIKGHEFTLLNSVQNDVILDELAHAEWLGVSQSHDATDFIQALSDEFWDWLIVDHYALDFRWESLLRQTVKKILVIDDLADRRHDCDLLLDQNLVMGMMSRYDKLLPGTCKQLLGPTYALLRQEFPARRDFTLPRRDVLTRVDRILVTFGGTDPDNVTGIVLEGIEKTCFSGVVDIVMGSGAPHLEAVIDQMAGMTSSVKVHVATQEMAVLMSNADLAIGAGGSTSWERCVLGLPSVIITTAKNQEPIAAGLENLGAAKWLGTSDQVNGKMLAVELAAITSETEILKKVGQNASRLCDGNGVERVVGEVFR